MNFLKKLKFLFSDPVKNTYVRYHMINWNLKEDKKKFETIYFILREYESGYRKLTINETGYCKIYKMHEDYIGPWEAWRLGISITDAEGNSLTEDEDGELLPQYTDEDSTYLDVKDYDGPFELVDDERDADSESETITIRNKETNEYWQASRYFISWDQSEDWNEVESSAIKQVKPVEKTIIVYEPI